MYHFTNIMWMSFCYLTTVHSVFSFEVTILHTNDVHARFEEVDAKGATCSTEDVSDGDLECYGGVAKRMTKISELREQHENTVLLDAGDQFQGTQWFYHYRGNATAHFMNLLDYDAMALNNHEFDGGVKVLGNFINQVQFSILSCTLDASNEPVLNGLFVKSLVLKFGSDKVGLVGFTHSSAEQISNPGANLNFKDEITSIQREVSQLTRSGVNKIIVMGIAGFEIEKQIAREVEGIDVLVGGDPFVLLYNGRPPIDANVVGPYPLVLEPEKREDNGRVLIVQTGSFGIFLGALTVTFDDRGRVSSYRGDPIILDSSVPKDQSTLTEVKKWKDPILKAYREVVGESYVLLDGDRTRCRTGECTMGNLVTDAMLSAYVIRGPVDAGWSDVSIAIINGGGIRSSISPGQITSADVTTVLPFGDTVDLIELKGYHLIEILEYSVEKLTEEIRGQFLQMSGIKVIYDARNTPGNRVMSVKVTCTSCDIPGYEDLVMNKYYKVIVTSYLAKGGDGYDTIKDNKKNHVTGSLDSTVVKQYLKKYSPITNAVENRITVLGYSSTAALPTASIILLTVSLLYLTRFIQ